MTDKDIVSMSGSLLEGVATAIEAASNRVAELFVSRDFQVSEKGPGDLLTSADLASNQILQEALRKLLPEAAWISEESEQDSSRMNGQFAWIVDPIDGTREFAHGIPEFSISVGLVADGRPILGAVALPADHISIIGSVGKGVFQFDGKIKTKIEPSATKPIDQAVICVSASEFEKGIFRDDHFRKFNIRPTGSVARKLALVAAGRYDANISLYPKNEWDICGGIALILSAGGSSVYCNEAESLWLPHLFNQPDLTTSGLIASRSADLVSQLTRYSIDDGWHIRSRYGEP